MSELRKLECLYAQHNDIKELPEFIGCDALREIHLSNNFITVSTTNVSFDQLTNFFFNRKLKEISVRAYLY